MDSSKKFLQENSTRAQKPCRIPILELLNWTNWKKRESSSGNSRAEKTEGRPLSLLRPQKKNHPSIQILSISLSEKAKTLEKWYGRFGEEKKNRGEQGIAVPSREDHESVGKLLPLMMIICGLEQAIQDCAAIGILWCEEEAGIGNEEAEEEELES